MSRKFVLIVILFIAAVFSACAQSLQQSQDSCNKYLEQSLAVSFCAPPNWTIAKGEPYQKVVGEKKEGLVPTITVGTSYYDGTAREFAIKALDYLLKNYGERGYTSVKVESQSDFDTKTTRAYKIVYDAETQGRGLRLIQYVFGGKGNTKILVTAYCLPSDKDVLDKVFDNAMKTFEVSQ